MLWCFDLLFGGSLGEEIGWRGFALPLDLPLHGALQTKVILLLLIGYPVGRSVQIIADRFLLEPYPRKAWGAQHDPQLAVIAVVPRPKGSAVDFPDPRDLNSVHDDR